MKNNYNNNHMYNRKCNSEYNCNSTIKGKPLTLEDSRKLLIAMLTVATMAGVLFVGGCVERFITVTTRPAGALVWLNDQEVGATPVKVPFTWYGQYGVVIRKDGYETINTSRKVKAPVYEWLGIDLFSECLWPGQIVDEHKWEFDLQKRKNTAAGPLIKRAQQLRTATLTVAQ